MKRLIKNFKKLGQNETRNQTKFRWIKVVNFTIDL